jgi:flagellar L-ring protein precursor FlgH
MTDQHHEQLRRPLLAAAALLALAAGGCAELIPVSPGKYAAAMPLAPTDASPPANGAIYQQAGPYSLVGDIKAHYVGDTITVQLAEKTQASKSASTDAKKDAAVDTGIPILAGTTIKLNGNNLLTNKFESKEDFTGQGSSSQSNSLNGNITVTVSQVLPNGNLVVRGEKWLTLNQGEEYVQIQGIVRPADIGADNSIPSYRVADARITYSGKGTLNDANRPGFLTRMLIKLWPL